MLINEIYKSIQGESSFAGQPCVFVRTTGCHLRCRWCDTAHAFHEGEEMTLESVLEKVASYSCGLVEITGGEPLLQKETPDLVKKLLGRGYTVLIETSGSVNIGSLDPRAHIIMDIKCPGSGVSDENLWENLALLKPTDQVKFVLSDRKDYEWAVRIVRQYPDLKEREILFSPAFGMLDPRRLAEWMLEDGLSARLQLQIHKYIWHPETRGV